jgi:hypothetical protein
MPDREGEARPGETLLLINGRSGFELVQDVAVPGSTQQWAGEDEVPTQGLRIGVRTRLDIGVASFRCDIVDDWVLGHNWGSAGSVAAVDL